MVARTTGLFAFFDLEDAGDCRTLSRNLRKALRDHSRFRPPVHLPPPLDGEFCLDFERASVIEMLIQHMERSPLLKDIINDYLNSASGDIPTLASAKSMDAYAQPEALYPRSENYKAAESAWRIRRPLERPPNFRQEYLPSAATATRDETGSTLDIHRGSTKHDSRGLAAESSNVFRQDRKMSVQSTFENAGYVTTNDTFYQQATKSGKDSPSNHKSVNEESFDDDDEIKPPGRRKRKSVSSSNATGNGPFSSPSAENKANNKKKRVALELLCSPIKRKRVRKEIKVKLSVRVLQEQQHPSQPTLVNFQVDSTSSPIINSGARASSTSVDNSTAIISDMKPARLGEVDTSKLEVVLETVQEDVEPLGRTIPIRRITKKYEHTVNFCNIEHVNKLNIWRTKIIGEALSITSDRSRLSSTRWLQIEKDYIVELLEEQLNSGQQTISWTSLADQYNRRMMGTIQESGEAFVLQNRSRVETLATPRLGPYRGQHAIKLQTGIWPESRKLIDDAKQELLAVHSLTRIRRSSSRKDEADSDDQGVELGEDSASLKQAFPGHHVIMDDKKCSLNDGSDARNPITITPSSPLPNRSSSVSHNSPQSSVPDNIVDLDLANVIISEPWTDVDAEAFDSQAILEELQTDEDDDDFPGETDDNSSSDESSY